MTVAVTDGTPSVEHAGTTYRFCGPGCASTFARNPARYLASA
jgi:YHS domain-containing protein